MTEDLASAIERASETVHDYPAAFAERVPRPYIPTDVLPSTKQPLPISISSSALGEGAVTNRKLTFLPALEFMKQVPPEVPWLVPRFVATGAITELVGKPKVAGKSTLLLAMSKAVVQGTDFLGVPTQQSPVVYLTEQGGTSFREGIVRSGPSDSADFHLLPWKDCARRGWPEIVEESVRFSQEVGAKLLIVDTLPQFAQIPGDAENNAGAALSALAPIQSAANTGLAVVVARHERKSGGDVGDSGRGSSAFTGSVDIVLALRRPEGGGLKNVRTIMAVSRFDETPDRLNIELLEDGRYVSHGDGESLGVRKARDYLLEQLPEDEGGATQIDDVVEGSGITRAMLYKAAKELFGEGLLGRNGKGVKGSAHHFWVTDSIGQDSHSKGDESN